MECLSTLIKGLWFRQRFTYCGKFRVFVGHWDTLGWRHCGHHFGCVLQQIIFQKNFHDDRYSFQIEKQKWQSDDLHESSLCHKNYKVRQTPTGKVDFEWKSYSLACGRHSAPTRFYLSYVFTILTMQQLSIVFFRFFNFFYSFSRDGKLQQRFIPPEKGFREK